MREAIEPNLIGTSLLQRIDFDGYGVSISFGTLGATAGLALDMAEGQEYPEFSVQHGSGSVTANIGKVGAVQRHDAAMGGQARDQYTTGSNIH